MQSDKSALRKHFLEIRHRLSMKERQMICNQIFHQLLTWTGYQQARTVFLYCALPEEIGTEQLLADALSKGKRVCVPLCTKERGIMEARTILETGQLKSGRFGVPEPPANAPLVRPSDIDLCIVPCLAADESGHRLGYGGGYYDRFLAQTTAQAAVLCMERCLLKALPAETHDLPCTIIVTERRIHIAG